MDKVFSDGLRVMLPPSTAPAFVKCRLAIDVEKFTRFIEDHANERGFVDLDVLESKNGDSWYATLNTWKVEKQAQPKPPQPVSDDDIADSIPF